MAAPPWLPNGVGGWLPASGSVHARLLGVVKTALLRQLVSRDALVCDLFCGRGTDTGRWAEAKIGRYIGVDLTGSALEEAREQWEQHQRPFPAEFCMLDPCMVDLESHLVNKGLPADVVSCFAHLQDCFTSEEIVKRLLKNVVAILKPGGFFFGTVPDSSTIWYKYQKAVQEGIKAGSVRANGTLPLVRTEIYKLTFDNDRFHLFGSKYHMRYVHDGLPAQPQLLVHFPSLIRLAKEVGLECLEIQNLLDFYEDHSGTFSDALRSSCETRGEQKGIAVLDQKNRLNSQALDVLSLYTTFVFKKCEATVSDPHIHPSSEPKFKISRPVAKYSAESSLEPSPLRASRHVKKEESSSPVPSKKSPANKYKSEQRDDPYRYDMEVDNVDPDVELTHSRMYAKMEPYQEGALEAMQDSSDLNTDENTGELEDNTRRAQQSESMDDEDRTNVTHGWASGRSAPLQGAATDIGDQVMRDPTGDLVADPRSVLLKHESGARSWRGGESSKPRPRQSSRGPRPARGFSAAAVQHSIKSEPMVVDESGYAQSPQATAETSKPFDHTKDRLYQTSSVELQGRASGNGSPRSSRRVSKDTSKRNDEKHHDPPAGMDLGTKHYIRRGHDGSSLDETSRTERRQGTPSGDHDSMHYRRRSRDSREERKKRETQQEPQQESIPGDPKMNPKHHHQRKALDTQHQMMKKPEPIEKQTAPVVIVNRTSLHYERRTHENVNDRSRIPNQVVPTVDHASKHYTQRSKDNSEAMRNDESRDERCTILSRKPKSSGVRSGTHVQSRRLP